MWATHGYSAMWTTYGRSAMWTTYGRSSAWATHGLSAAWATCGFVLDQLDIGRGNNCIERLRVDWDSMGRIVVCDREHGSDGER